MDSHTMITCGVLPAGEIWMQEINPVLGVRVGPGATGFACISSKERG